MKYVYTKVVDKLKSSTKSEEKRFMLFEKNILRKMYGSRRNEEENTYQRRTNTELRAMFNVPDNILQDCSNAKE